jgi:flap endonuclease-1
MAIYQFLIAVRQSSNSNPASMLTNADGEITSHVQGLFNRTIRFLTEGVRPVYVFDGKPPNIKSHELIKRREKREKATKELEKAKEEGNIEEQEKQSKRLVRAGQKENNDCKKLLRLMGVPVVEAPCEAEAQAASLCAQGKVWAVGTEDMDALTFKTPILLRKMTFANASKSDIQQMNYKKAIEGLGLTHSEFVDLCILLGCDYCDSIRGIGPKTALKLIRQHSSIENILDNLDRKKYTVPHEWVPHEKKEKETEEKSEDDDNDTGKEDAEKGNGEDDDDNEEEKKDKENENASKEEEEVAVAVPIYVRARQLFNEHEVHTDIELKWTSCQEEELTKFLVQDMGFAEERVKTNIAKLQKAFKATSKPQLRMDSFFKPVPGAAKNKNAAKAGLKRKGGKIATKKPAKKGSFGRKR